MTDVHASADDGYASAALLRRVVDAAAVAVAPAAYVLTGDDAHTEGTPGSAEGGGGGGRGRGGWRWWSSAAAALLLGRPSVVDAAEAAAVSAALAPAVAAGVPVLRTRGNHDVAGGSDTDSGGSSRGGGTSPACVTVSTAAGVRFVMLDGAVGPPAPRRPLNFWGALRREDVARLASELATASPERPTVVLSHHPVGTLVGALPAVWARWGPRGTGGGGGAPHTALVDVLAAAPMGVHAYLCGHLHHLHGLAPGGLSSILRRRPLRRASPEGQTLRGGDTTATAVASPGMAHLQLRALSSGATAPAVRVFVVWHGVLAWATTSVAALEAAAAARGTATSASPAAAAAVTAAAGVATDGDPLKGREAVLLLAPRGGQGGGGHSGEDDLRASVGASGVSFVVLGGGDAPRAVAVALDGRVGGVAPAVRPRVAVSMGWSLPEGGVPRHWGVDGVRLVVCQLEGDAAAAAAATAGEGGRVGDDGGCGGVTLLDEVVVVSGPDIRWTAAGPPRSSSAAGVSAIRTAGRTAAGVAAATIGLSDVATLFPQLIAFGIAALAALTAYSAATAAPTEVTAMGVLLAAGAAVLAAPGVPLLVASNLLAPAGGAAYASHLQPAMTTAAIVVPPVVAPSAEGLFLLVGLLWRSAVPVGWALAARGAGVTRWVRVPAAAVGAGWAAAWVGNVAGAHGWEAVAASPAVGAAAAVVGAAAVVAVKAGGRKGRGEPRLRVKYD
ncbi:hypothetical protein MMPV_006761 [Pyropia vietnamensis]